MSEAVFASLGPTLLARKGGAKPAMRPQVAPLVADEAEIAALADEQLEDLGWNDMGDHDSDSENSADVVPINATVAATDAAATQSPIIRRQQRRLEERVLADAAMGSPEGEPEETSDMPGADADYELECAEAFEEGQEEGDENEDYGEEYNEAAYAPITQATSTAPAPASVPVIRQALAPRALGRKAQSTSERRAAFTLRLDPERHLKLRLAATMQGVSAQVLLTEALDAMLAEYDDLDVIAAHLKRH